MVYLRWLATNVVGSKRQEEGSTRAMQQLYLWLFNHWARLEVEA